MNTRQVETADQNGANLKAGARWRPRPRESIDIGTEGRASQRISVGELVESTVLDEIVRIVVRELLDEF
ncbi:MAG TPA: hypothetical protein VGG72_03545 [Bryobacteraceae bacterium]|jgi:hypothetical protein